MENRDLARLILAERGQLAARARRESLPQPPYYMLNINHPLIRELYDRWKAFRQISKSDAPGDLERTEFELELMAAGAKRAMAEHFRRLAEAQEKMGGSADGKDGL